MPRITKCLMPERPSPRACPPSSPPFPTTANNKQQADDIFSRGVSKKKMRKHRTHWPTGFHKEDISGRPVFYDRVGQSDLAALRADPDGLDQDEMVQIFCQNMEVGEQG